MAKINIIPKYLKDTGGRVIITVLFNIHLIPTKKKKIRKERKQKKKRKPKI